MDKALSLLDQVKSNEMEEAVAIIHSWGKILFTCCQETGGYFWGSDTAVILRVHHMRFKLHCSICST